MAGFGIAIVLVTLFQLRETVKADWSRLSLAGSVHSYRDILHNRQYVTVTVALTALIGAVYANSARLHTLRTLPTRAVRLAGRPTRPFATVHCMMRQWSSQARLLTSARWKSGNPCRVRRAHSGRVEQSGYRAATDHRAPAALFREEME
jgi:hypothetical protein